MLATYNHDDPSWNHAIDAPPTNLLGWFGAASRRRAGAEFRRRGACCCRSCRSTGRCGCWPGAGWSGFGCGFLLPCRFCSPRHWRWRSCRRPSAGRTMSASAASSAAIARHYLDPFGAARRSRRWRPRLWRDSILLYVMGFVSDPASTTSEIDETVVTRPRRAPTVKGGKTAPAAVRGDPSAGCGGRGDEPPADASTARAGHRRRRTGARARRCAADRRWPDRAARRHRAAAKREQAPRSGAPGLARSRHRRLELPPLDLLTRAAAAARDHDRQQRGAAAECAPARKRARGFRHSRPDREGAARARW